MAGAGIIQGRRRRKRRGGEEGGVEVWRSFYIVNSFSAATVDCMCKDFRHAVACKQNRAGRSQTFQSKLERWKQSFVAEQRKSALGELGVRRSMMWKVARGISKRAGHFGTRPVLLMVLLFVQASTTPLFTDTGTPLSATSAAETSSLASWITCEGSPCGHRCCRDPVAFLHHSVPLQAA